MKINRICFHDAYNFFNILLNNSHFEENKNDANKMIA